MPSLLCMGLGNPVWGTESHGVVCDKGGRGHRSVCPWICVLRMSIWPGSGGAFLGSFSSMFALSYSSGFVLSYCILLLFLRCLYFLLGVGCHRGQHIQSAMDKPHLGKTTFVIMVSPLSGKYACLFSNETERR